MMTAAEERFWKLVHRRTIGLQLDVAAALLRSFAIIRASLSEAELALLIAQGAFARILADALSDQVLDRALIPFRKQIHQTTERGFILTTAELPRGGKVNGVLAVHFDPLSPKIIAAVRELDTRLVDAVKQDVRDVVIAQAQIGLKANVPPIVIARQIPSVIGLGPTQVEQIAGFRATLAGEPGHSITDYTLRDPKVDAMLEKGPLTATQIDRATTRYATERVAGNVAAISNTAARQSYKTGQDLAWKSAQDAGVVKDGDQLFKKWLQVDRPSKRPSHAKMNGIIVPIDQRYPNGQMVPGEDPNDYNCACVSQILVERGGRFVTPPT